MRTTSDKLCKANKAPVMLCVRSAPDVTRIGTMQYSWSAGTFHSCSTGGRGGAEREQPCCGPLIIYCASSSWRISVRPAPQNNQVPRTI